MEGDVYGDDDGRSGPSPPPWYLCVSLLSQMFLLLSLSSSFYSELVKVVFHSVRKGAS